MKKRSLEMFLFSTLGVVAMFVVLLAFNVLTGAVKQRIDLTQEKAFTLSPGTRAVLAKIDSPIKIRFYCTRAETPVPEMVLLKAHARRIEDLLGEYKQAARGRILIEKLDPKPDSDAEDSARLDGVEPELLSNGERFYLGLAVSRLDVKQTLPFLPPNRERLLEYDITRAIAGVINPEKPVIGIMSALPVFGMPGGPMFMRPGQQGQEPWLIVTELRKDFTVKNVGLDVEKIDDDIKVLLVIHPRDISEKTQFALDQFVLRGGKLIAFLDAFSLVDNRGQQNPMFGEGGGSSSLPKLLKAWGYTFETGKVVADLNFKMQMLRNNRPVDMPTILGVTAVGINREDIVTSQMDNIWLPMCGAFTGTPAEGLQQTVLLKSTPESQLVDGFLANLSGESVIKEFRSSGVPYTLALRLTGKFKTAFPEGKPGETRSEAGDGDTEKKDAAKDEGILKEGNGEGVVVLFGDADMLFDQFTMRQIPTPFGTVAMPMNANLNLAQSLVELLSGDSHLISIRSRATIARPFTVVRQMQARAQEAYQSRIRDLEAKLTETQRRLNELQQTKEKGQRFILSPEQEAEIAKFRREQAETNKQLKELRKNLRRDIESLETRLKWANIFGMPLAVSLFGVVLAVIKKKRTGAK